MMQFILCVSSSGRVLTDEDYLVLSSGFGKNDWTECCNMHCGVCELVGQQNEVTVSGTLPEAKTGFLGLHVGNEFRDVCIVFIKHGGGFVHNRQFRVFSEVKLVMCKNSEQLAFFYPNKRPTYKELISLKDLAALEENCDKIRDV